MGKSGLTFIEILITALILGSVVHVFIGQMINFRYAAQRNRERIIAYNLVREKIEELRAVPIRQLRGDWEVYRGESSAGVTNIFRDEFFGTWAKMDEDKELFWNKMSDIITKKGKSASGAMPEGVFSKFKRNYQQQYGLTYEPYDEEYRIYRRTTKIEDLTAPENKGNILKRVSVTVEIDSKVHKKFRVGLASYYSNN